MVIINADDFGYSYQVNLAISRCFEEGVVSSTTIMANMEGFEHAVALASDRGLSRRTGIHMNITEGRPLTGRILYEKRFCNDDGEFCFERNQRILLSGSERNVLVEEIESQILRCLNAGLGLTHLDSHHHVHTEWSVFNAILPLVRKYNITYVRPSRNDRVSRSLVRRCYKGMFNMRLSYMGLRKTKYFGDCEGFKSLKAQKYTETGSVEIMVHPGLRSDGIVIDRLDQRQIIPIIKDLTAGTIICGFTCE